MINIFSRLILAPLFTFVIRLVERFGAWFLTAYLSGALKSLVITLVLFTAFATLITQLISTANEYLLDALRNGSLPAQYVIAPIAAMLPPSLGVCATIIASVYMAGVTYNLAKEIAKVKARAAERAAGFFKA